MICYYPSLLISYRGRRKTNNVVLNNNLKGIINRIAEEFEISNRVIYGKIDFLYEQALAFDEFQSYFLSKALERKSLNLSSD